MPLSLQTAAQLLQTLEQRRQRSLLPTHVAPFDRLLGPAGVSGNGGLTRGSMIELAGPRSSGRFALALAALAAATRCGEAAALVDRGDHLEPASAETAGVDLRRLLWVRPRTTRQAVMSAEMVLSAGFAVVVLDLGAAPLPLHRVPPSVWVRLGRAAETHNAAFLLLSPTPIRSVAAGALVTTAGGRGVWGGDGPSPRLLSGIAARLTVLRRKGERAERAAGLSLGVRDQIHWEEGA
jgi:hypothetical protein